MSQENESSIELELGRLQIDDTRPALSNRPHVVSGSVGHADGKIEPIPRYMSDVPEQPPENRPLIIPQIGTDLHKKVFGTRVPARSLKAISPTQRLCSSCDTIRLTDLLENKWRTHFQKFLDLESSAESCSLCAMIYNACQREDAFVPDPQRPVHLVSRASWDPQSPHWGDVMLPVFECDGGNDDSIYRTYVKNIRGEPGKAMVLGKGLALFADHGTHTAEKLAERPIHPNNDLSQPRAWLDDCVRTHERCNQALRALSLRQGAHMPTRLLEINRARNGTLFLKLRETKGIAKSPYLALSYRWANVTVTTLTENYKQRQTRLEIDELNQVFRDIVYATKDLGLSYLWIDALCIVQDDERDKMREISVMADIFRNAHLVVTASTTTAPTSGLFQARRRSNAVRLPYDKRDKLGRRRRGWYFVSDRDWHGREYGFQHVSTFRSDVTNGPLAQRGWCLQERALSARILHFGADQKHWECLSGFMDETRPHLEDWQFDPLTNMRKMIFSQHTFRTAPVQSSVHPSTRALREGPTNAGSESLLRVFRSDTDFGKPPYSTWYKLVEQFTSRQLTHESDKLAAIAGVASAFSHYVEDRYAAGLWVSDLVAGLLWSKKKDNNSDDDDDDDDEENNISDQITADARAPTWSWARMVGRVAWPHPLSGKMSEQFLDSARVCMTHELEDNDFSPLKACFLLIRGLVRPLQGMGCFSEEFLSWLKENADKIDYDCVPSLMWDICSLPLDRVTCLMLCAVECHPNCRHATGCDQDPMVYCLLLVKSPNEEQYVRTGAGAPGSIYARIGLAKLYMRAFSDVEASDIVIH